MYIFQHNCKKKWHKTDQFSTLPCLSAFFCCYLSAQSKIATGSISWIWRSHKLSWNMQHGYGLTDYEVLPTQDHQCSGHVVCKSGMSFTVPSKGCLWIHDRRINTTTILWITIIASSAGTELKLQVPAGDNHQSPNADFFHWGYFSLMMSLTFSKYMIYI